MSYRGRLSNKGFTLIEMLIGIVIMGMAISMLSISMNQSVRNQEKMENLLDIYQVAITSKTKIIEQLKKGRTSGSFENGTVTINWTAKLLEQNDEAPIFMVDTVSLSIPSFNMKYYKVTSIHQSPHARRVYEFEHMVERHKSQLR